MIGVSDRVRLGVVGCGVVATAYYLPFILDHEEAALVAVCDLDGERARACARLFGAAETYTDYFAMLERSELDAVLILTAPGTHARFALAAAERGLHLLLQKPMALTLADATAIVEAVDAAGVKCVVEPSSQSPLDPDWRHLRALIDRGVLGDPYWFTLIPKAGPRYSGMLGGNPYGNAAFFAKDSGGVIFDYPYMPTQIVTLLGDCASVVATARISAPDRMIVPEGDYTRWLSERTDPRDCNYWDAVLTMEKTERIVMEANDNVFSTYTMASGWVGDVHVGRPFHPTYGDTAGSGGLQVFGVGGNLILGGPHMASFISERRDLLPEVDEAGWYHVPARGDLTKARWPQPVPGAFNYYAESTRHLCDCILRDEEPVVNASWGRHITEMMWGSLESSRTGRRYTMTTTTRGLREGGGVGVV
ncbi:Gfo/Idh/MocA family protein [Mucisphaera calidilacus]|uniref:Inositol 2-dehydrogenase n=1 Tax=Mucisphaera calidilacus TaxID=2527982 RepID=A0A518BUG2_9BACT|nr:Gfo/Idh/MocA family oxidoreductase [Mucisphaera calidilacus]QDU70577.1 Inositol 2-dehydrogenase [Mucisphaera calidilacus]